MTEALAEQIERLITEVTELRTKLPDLVLREEVERKEKELTAALGRVRKLVIAAVVFGLALTLVMALIVVNANRQSDATKAEGRRSREVLCAYLSRYGEAAKLDRQALIVFATRPGAVLSDEQRAVIEGYLAFGKEAYPVLDCSAVVKGSSPPALPPLPSRPTVAPS